MWNCYKREDVFLCRHDFHRRFDHRVSAYHVLIEKRCYPEGCVAFAWKCKRMHQGEGCPKGYHHVGSNCTQCRFYDEEKILRRPAVQLDEAQFAEFMEDCRAFDDWLEQLRHRPVDLGGRVTDVRPHLVRRVDGRRSSLSLLGYLVRLQPGFIGLQGIDEALYLEVSRAQQERLGIASGDRVEAEVWVCLDRGRLVGLKPRRLRIEERNGGRPPSWDGALIDREGAVVLPSQPERCLRCDRGVLVDVEQAEVGRRPARRRELLCLEGIGRPHECPYEGLRALGGQPQDRSCVGLPQDPAPGLAHPGGIQRRTIG
jgi:hypothetical protein